MAKDREGVYRDLARPVRGDRIPCCVAADEAVERNRRAGIDQGGFDLFEAGAFDRYQKRSAAKGGIGKAKISAMEDRAGRYRVRPGERNAQVSTSVTMALSATRENTNTGSAAGWSRRVRGTAAAR